MTYFLSDPIPALCDQASAHYSSALQNHGQEGKTSQVGCYRHATGRNGNTSHGRKRVQPETYLHIVLSLYSVLDCVPLFACVNGDSNPAISPFCAENNQETAELMNAVFV